MEPTLALARFPGPGIGNYAAAQQSRDFVLRVSELGENFLAVLAERRGDADGRGVSIRAAVAHRKCGHSYLALSGMFELMPEPNIPHMAVLN